MWGFGLHSYPLRRAYLNNRICCRLPRPKPARRKTCQVFLCMVQHVPSGTQAWTGPLGVKLANRRVGPRSRVALATAERHRARVAGHVDEALGVGGDAGCGGALVAAEVAAVRERGVDRERVMRIVSA